MVGNASAEVAELADAQASGACGGNLVGVQIPPSAPCTTRFAWVHGGAKVPIPKKRDSRGACPESKRSPEPSEVQGAARGSGFSAKMHDLQAPLGFWYVYVLQSERDGGLYVGSTNLLRRRLYEHAMGKTTSTARRRPLRLIYFEGHLSKLDAARRERYFKTARGKRSLYQMIRDSLQKTSDRV